MTEPTTDTRSLVTRARRGDRAAFDELAARVRSRLLGRIRGLIGPRLRQKADPEDVLQEVLLRGFEAIERFEGDDENAFRGWTEGIARNLVRNLARKKSSRSEFALVRDVPASGASPSRNQRREERFDRLSKSVDELCPDHREVIQLARIEGLKVREIAARMGRSEAAVKSLLLRAMRALRSSFGETESFGLPDRRLGDGTDHHVD